MLGAMVLDQDLPQAFCGEFRALWEQGDLRALEVLHSARNGVGARPHALLLLTIGRLHLRRGEGQLASRWFDEGLGLTRSHRLARPLRADLLVGASVAARVTLDFARAEHHAVAAQRSAQDARQRASALLAQASARRLSGDAWGSLMPTHAALEYGSALEGEVARTLAWMTLSPADTTRQAQEQASRSTGALRARLAWFLVEQALEAGDERSAAGWTKVAANEPFAAEELLLCPLARGQNPRQVSPTSPSRGVRVLTLERQGLQTGERFLSVPGDGRLTALLAFLIEGGTTHWERAADAVLGGGSKEALYGQVRHHLTTLRGLLGDPGAVTSRKGLISLDTTRHWSCDALDPGASSPNWLPHVHGWWIEQKRAQLSSRA